MRRAERAPRPRETTVRPMIEPDMKEVTKASFKPLSAATAVLVLE
jgi:hypothetical protein